MGSNYAIDMKEGIVYDEVSWKISYYSLFMTMDNKRPGVKFQGRRELLQTWPLLSTLGPPAMNLK
jgi:hypothetical protein